MTIETLSERFSGAGISFRADEAGRPVLELEHSNGNVSISLYGAHVLDYRTAAGEAVLWLSREALFAPGKPIRGGIPICWPWFGPHGDDEAKPAHGLARIADWSLEAVSADPESDVAEATLVLRDSDWSRSLWPYRFELVYRVRLLTSALEIQLSTENTGSEALSLTSALHTYFAVASLADTAVTGLNGVSYLDQLDGMTLKEQVGDVKFAAEVDRIYVDAPGETGLSGALCGKPIRVNSRGSRSTVVWNPWIEKSKRMADYGDQEYHEMVCIETANAGPDRISLAPGERHQLAAVITVGA